MIISINEMSEIPIYQQIRNQIVQGISDGRLSPGEQLPTVRGLAEEIGVVLIAALSGLVAKLEALLEGSKGIESVVRNESFCRAFACGNRASFELFHCYFASLVMISRISALV